MKELKEFTLNLEPQTPYLEPRTLEPQTDLPREMRSLFHRGQTDQIDQIELLTRNLYINYNVPSSAVRISNRKG